MGATASSAEICSPMEFCRSTETDSRRQFPRQTIAGMCRRIATSSLELAATASRKTLQMRRTAPILLALTIGAWSNGKALSGAQPRDSAHPKLAPAAAPAGVRSYSPGTWSMVSSTLINPTDAPLYVAPLLHFEDEPTLQYGRQFWLPARSKRQSWLLVRLPDEIRDVKGVQTRTILYDRTGSNDARVPGPGGQIFYDGILPVDQDYDTTVLIADTVPGVSDASGSESDGCGRAAAMAIRTSTDRSPRVRELDGPFMPPLVEALDGMDHLVLCGDRLAQDAAGLDAVRRWLHRGGRLWIMLDQVQPETVELLLDDVCTLEIVDRTELTEVQIEGLGPAARDSDQHPREFESPVEMVFVLARNVELSHTVNGWPASFWQEVGAGKILYTTLGMEAWLRPRTPHDVLPLDQNNQVQYVAREPLGFLAKRLLNRVEPVKSPVRLQDLEPYLAEQVGYEVAGRGTVAGILGLFCGSLLVASVVLSRRKRLERMAWLAPAAAAFASFVLAAVGAQSRLAVPSAVAEAQVVTTVPGSAEIQTSGLLMFYNQGASPARIGAARGGLFFPDMSGLEGETRRMVWTDLDRWHWEHLTLPAGTRVAPFEQSVAIETPIEARAVFGAEGLNGRLAAGPLQGIGDLVLAAPSGRHLAVTLDGRGRFTAGPGHILAPGEFIAGAILSDERRRRQRLYAGLFENYRPAHPTLFLWAEPLETQFVYPKGARRLGSALVSVPVRFERTPSGERVLIPHPLVTYRSVSGPGGQPSLSPYDNFRGEWNEHSGSSESWLRFQLPLEVLPLQLDGAIVTIRLRGPVERLEIMGLVDGRMKPLWSRDNPAGTIRAGIDEIPTLQIDNEGGLLLGLRIAAPPRTATSGSKDYWRIESLQVDVTGRTLPEPGE